MFPRARGAKMPPDQTCAHFTHDARVIFEAQTQARMCLLSSSRSVPDAVFMPCVFLLRARLFSCLDTQDFMRTAL